MFLTYTNWKLTFPNFLCAPNQQCWSGVELALKKPWFLMTVSQIELVESGENFVFRRDIMVSTASEVKRLAQECDDRLQKLECAMIVIPNWINGTSTWSIEPLAAIWVADEPEAPGAPVEICETQSGAKFVTTFGACSLEKLTNQTLLYSFPVQEK